MSLYHELKRRNVFRVAIAYLALAWLLTEVAGTVFPVFGIPDWGVSGCRQRPEAAQRLTFETLKCIWPHQRKMYPAPLTLDQYQ